MTFPTYQWNQQNNAEIAKHLSINTHLSSANCVSDRGLSQNKFHYGKPKTSPEVIASFLKRTLKPMNKVVLSPFHQHFLLKVFSSFQSFFLAFFTEIMVHFERYIFFFFFFFNCLFYILILLETKVGRASKGNVLMRECTC